MSTTVASDMTVSSKLNPTDDGRREEFLKEFFEKEPYLRMETLTAEQAGWLRETSKGNRRQVKSNSIRIAQDMAEGNFRPGNDALLFRTDNSLGNGHHRLDEQIAVGVSITYIVRTHVPDEEMAVIDHGASRNARASLDFLPEFTSQYGTLKGNEGVYITAVLREGGRKAVYITPHKLGKALLNFKEELEWIFGIIGTKRIPRITHAGTVAPFIRAYRAGHDKDKLTVALQYLVNGPQGLEQSGVENNVPGMKSIYALREHLIGMKSGAGDSATREIYDKVERMLNAYLEGDDMQKVYAAKGELFPIKVDEILTPPTDLDRQRDILGSDLHRALMRWADSAPDRVEFKPNEIVESILETVGVDLKPSTVASKLSKAAKELGGYIDIPNKGKLLAFGPQQVKAQKVTYYEFQKKKQQDSEKK
jgi:hypothetical protein